MIGKLRHRVTIQKNTPTRVKGVRTDNWRDVNEVYANVRTLRGSERSMADQKESVLSHEVTMRYRASLSDDFEFLDGEIFEFLDGERFTFLIGDTEALARYRVKFGNRFFDIRSVLHPEPRREHTVMRVEEVVT